MTKGIIFGIAGLAFILLAWGELLSWYKRDNQKPANPDNLNLMSDEVINISLADIEKRAEDLYLKEKVPEADRAAFYQGYRNGLSDMIIFYTR